MTALFPVDVPFDLPVFAFGKDEFYKVLKNRTVVFRPREWRGSGSSNLPFSGKEYLNATAMAAELNGYPPGTVAYIYLTSDGGASLSEFYDLVPKLGEHVLQLLQQKEAADTPCSGGLPPPPPLGYRHFLAHS